MASKGKRREQNIQRILARIKQGVFSIERKKQNKKQQLESKTKSRLTKSQYTFTYIYTAIYLHESREVTGF